MNEEFNTMVRKLNTKIAYLSDLAINTGFTMFPDYSDKRGYGWRVKGRGVRDHFISENETKNSTDTITTLLRVTSRVHSLELRLFGRGI